MGRKNAAASHQAENLDTQRRECNEIDASQQPQKEPAAEMKGG